MRIYISVDMEGVSGVTRWEDVVTRGQDYQRARSWMTADVNAAIAGAREAGATEFVVEENHGVEMLCNLLLDEIDPEAEVVRGLPRGGATTMAALDASFAAMFLVGHHAAAGDRPGICAHTISYTDYRVVRCNGTPIGEGEMFATVAAAHGVPTALVTGDQVVAERMSRCNPGIETAVVKHALSHTAARIVPPARAAGIIRAAAQRAVERVAGGDIEPAGLPGPYEFDVELLQPLSDAARTDITDRFPELTIVGDRTLAWTSDDMHTCFRRAAIASHLAANPGTVRRY